MRLMQLVKLLINLSIIGYLNLLNLPTQSAELKA
jgi:hypothetical protein